MSDIPIVKVAIVGDANVGKTSLVRRFSDGKFQQSRVATLGADFQTKVVSLPRGDVKLSIWDMGGQKQFEPVRRVFYSGTAASALVYDMTSLESLKNLEIWREELLTETKNQNFVVVGNKADLDSEVYEEAGERLAEIFKAKHFITSAFDGRGVEEMFDELARLAVGNY
ncbi:MAG: GTP-binding protein [Chloroflexota bacterium]